MQPYYSLEGSAEEAVLELELTDINSDAGLEKVLQKLDKLYLKDSTVEKFQALESFDAYKRKTHTSIQEHIHQFEKLYYKLQRHGTKISEDLLAYKLLKSANLSKQDEKLEKGTVKELTLTNMKVQLKKIFLDKESLSTLSSEPLSIHDINEVTSEDIDCEPLKTFYTGRRNVPTNRQYTPPRRQQTYNNIPSTRRHSSSPQNFTTINPRNIRTGETTRCNICESIFHWAASCSDKQHRTYDNQLPIRSRVQTPQQTRHIYYEQHHNHSDNLEQQPKYVSYEQHSDQYDD